MCSFGVGFYMFIRQKYTYVSKQTKNYNTKQDMAFSDNVDFDNTDDNTETKTKMTKRLDEDDKENEIEGVGDIDHMKESQEESTSVEVQEGPGGLAGLIANLSGVSKFFNAIDSSHK